MEFTSKLGPGDLAPYFRAPLEQTFSLGMTPAKIALGDPMRWSILFSCPSAFASARISTLPGVASTGGITISGTNQGPTVLTFADVGPLVQQAWYAFGGAASFITVITVSLSQWPGSVPASQSNLIERTDRGDFKSPFNIYRQPPPRSRLYGYRWNPNR